MGMGRCVFDVPKNTRRELLFSVTKKDFDVQTFRAGGKGGQNQNKRNTGVRIIHRDSGAVGESREHRTQGQNKKAAFERLVASKKFMNWHRIEVSRRLMDMEQIERQVDEMMTFENLKVEYGEGKA